MKIDDEMKTALELFYCDLCEHGQYFAPDTPTRRGVDSLSERFFVIMCELGVEPPDPIQPNEKVPF